MKNLILILATLVSTPALADGAFYCHGIGRDEGKTLYAKSLDDVLTEGESMKFLFVVRDGSETIYSDRVVAELEDVILNFNSFRGPKMNATIFLDELDQTSVTIGRKEMRFDCGRN